MGKATARCAALALFAGLLLAGCGDDNGPKNTGPAGALPGGGGNTAPLQIGQPAVTAGSDNPINGPGGGKMEITPVAVVYRPADGTNKPDNGLFLTVGFKHASVEGTPAPTAPIDGGGWKYITPEGQAIEQGNGSHAFSVTANAFNDPGPVQPGTFTYDATSWDISEAQRGGTILYTDGDGKVFRWTVPAQDGGPELEKLKTDLGD